MIVHNFIPKRRSRVDEAIFKFENSYGLLVRRLETAMLNNKLDRQKGRQLIKELDNMFDAMPETIEAYTSE